MSLPNSSSNETKGEGYHILTAGYSGAVTPLVFQPPSTLKIRGDELKNQTGSSPSWITFAQKGFKKDILSNKQIAYVTSEEEEGSVYTLSKENGKDHSFNVIGKNKSTGGSGPVASCVQNSCLYVANYNSGSCSVIQLTQEGIPIEKGDGPSKVFQFTRIGTGPVTDRQNQSYAHDATASPDGKWVYVPDLGADQIHHILTTDGDCSNTSNHTDSTQVGQGTGPRHIAFYREESGRQFAYLTSELASTLTAFEHDPVSGKLSLVGEPILSVPNGTPLGGSTTAGPQLTTAELAISPDGRYVYVSDRGDEQEDHISIYKRNQIDGSIEFLEWVPSGGKMPRHFSLSNDGLYAVVAHQTTGNVVILKRDPITGSLSKTGAEISDLEQVNFAGFEPSIVNNFGFKMSHIDIFH